jgi:hypothetical protein
MTIKCNTDCNSVGKISIVALRSQSKSLKQSRLEVELFDVHNWLKDELKILFGFAVENVVVVGLHGLWRGELARCYPQNPVNLLDTCEGCPACRAPDRNSFRNRLQCKYYAHSTP